MSDTVAPPYSNKSLVEQKNDLTAGLLLLYRFLYLNWASKAVNNFWEVEFDRENIPLRSISINFAVGCSHVHSVLCLHRSVRSII